MELFLCSLESAKDPAELEAALIGSASLGNLSLLSNENKDLIRNKMILILEDEKLVNNAKIRRRVKRFVSSLDETDKLVSSQDDTQEESAKDKISSTGSVYIADAAAKIDSCTTLFDLERVMNSIVLPTKQNPELFAVLQTCKLTLVSSLQNTLKNELITNKLIRRRISRMIYALSDEQEQAAIKLNQQKKALKESNNSTCTSSRKTDQAQVADSTVDTKREICYSEASVLQCIELLNAAGIPSDVEAAIDVLTSDGPGPDSTKALQSRLQSIVENDSLVGNAKLRRRLKRLISSLDSQNQSESIANPETSLQSSTQSEYGYQREAPAVQPQQEMRVTKINTAALATFSECLALLASVQSADDIETALSNISIESAGDANTKRAVRVRLEELSLNEELINSSKLRRKVKRLCEMLAKEEEKDLAQVLETVGEPLEDIISRVNGLLESSASIDALEDILVEIKPNAGNCSSRRTLKRAIARAVGNAEANGAVVSASLRCVIEKALDSLSPKPGSGELVAKLLEKKKAATAAPSDQTAKGQATGDTAAGIGGNDAGEGQGPPAGSLYVLFAGQLPFNVTAADLEQHLRDNGIEGEITIRMLTEEGSEKSRGMAFIQVEGARELRKCLALHHSFLQGRRINIEKSCGGRNKELRTTKIQQQRSMQHASNMEAVTAVLKSFEDKGMPSIDSIEEGVLSRLFRLSAEVATKIVGQFVTLSPEHRSMSELSRIVTMHEEGRQGSFVGKPPPPKNRRQVEDDDSNGNSGHDHGGEGSAEGESPKRKKHRVELPADDNVPWGYSTRPAAESYSYNDGRKASRNVSAEGRSSLEDVFPSVRGRGGKANVGSRIANST